MIASESYLEQGWPFTREKIKNVTVPSSKESNVLFYFIFFKEFKFLIYIRTEIGYKNTYICTNIYEIK